MEIHIKSIPKEQHRYDTSGDYWYGENGVLEVRITEMEKRSMELVLLHELVEHFITEHQGITHEEIDKFDKAYEAARLSNDGEPGDAPDCPYKDAHLFAIAIEMLLANKLEVDWLEHDNRIME